MENIKGKVVVITGASSGFGKITAEYLSERGAAVALGARSTEKITTIAKSIREKGGKALAVTTDVTNKDQEKIW